ncbi:DUF5082 domain-containing protein [Halobacillus shinanisalinarum]|uniref:DUF5082 domain-containing protein n=1 Tax=Halobacillus shinanisalinarum TaxID=2932258 RepID=A0ABY4H293_9BACI|nr:DUF5082 family protein [Halobacillus shinanisalinarum]UOQ94572.1 DUF5082 domain-containing protein [Halobacillus shinanisalinarum]
MSENEIRVMSLYNDISLLRNNLHDNQEKLQRLRLAKSEISNEQGELSAQKRLLSEPDLSHSLWAGKHATEFLNIRENIEQSYVTIITQQVEALLEDIEGKITQLEHANNGISTSIVSKNETIDQLKTK